MHKIKEINRRHKNNFNQTGCVLESRNNGRSAKQNNQDAAIILNNGITKLFGS